MIRGLLYRTVACAVCGMASPADIFQSTTNPMGSVDGRNKFVDEIFEKATSKENVGEIEPAVMNQNYTKDIDAGWAGKIHVSIYNSQITGLSTLRREGNCRTKISDGKSGMMVPIAFDTIEIRSSAVLTYNDLGPDVTVKGKIGPSTAEMFVYVSHDKETGKVIATVLYILIKKMGNVEATLEGLDDGFGIMSWASNMIKSAFTVFYREIIRLVIGAVLVPYVNSLIDVKTYTQTPIVPSKY